MSPLRPPGRKWRASRDVCAADEAMGNPRRTPSLYMGVATRTSMGTRRHVNDRVAAESATLQPPRRRHASQRTCWRDNGGNGRSTGAASAATAAAARRSLAAWCGQAEGRGPMTLRGQAARRRLIMAGRRVMAGRHVVAGGHVVARRLVVVGRHVVARQHVEDRAATGSVKLQPPRRRHA